jgi:hypothetical protein
VARWQKYERDLVKLFATLPGQAKPQKRSPEKSGLIEPLRAGRRLTAGDGQELRRTHDALTGTGFKRHRACDQPEQQILRWTNPIAGRLTPWAT